VTNYQDPSPTPAKFPVGAAVRVKLGTIDPDFPDIPLGGWAGTIQKSEPPAYLVNWNQHTLDQMNPVYRKRCERDELELEAMWLDENDLELDTGNIAKIEQPTTLVSLPLSPKVQDDRVRVIFGLTSDDPLPWVTEENLNKYHHHLETRLSFPFEAKYMVEAGPRMEKECSVTVMRLLDPDEGDTTTGLLCEADQEGETTELPLADIEGMINLQNGQLIEDYAYWFDNFNEEESPASDLLPGVPFNFPSSFPKKRMSFTAALMLVLVWGIVVGMVLGSLIASMEVARIMALCGAVLLGFLGLIAGSRFGKIFGTLNQLRWASHWGGFLGAVVGGIVGALLGAMMAAIVGLLTGSLLGALVSNLVLGGRRKVLSTYLGSMVGATVQAFLLDQEQALVGAIYGGVIGAGAAIVAMIGLNALAAVYRGR
jgi:hypothetical protein